MVSVRGRGRRCGRRKGGHGGGPGRSKVSGIARVAIDQSCGPMSSEDPPKKVQMSQPWSTRGSFGSQTGNTSRQHPSGSIVDNLVLEAEFSLGNASRIKHRYH